MGAGPGRGLRVLPAERRPVALMVLLNALICLGAVSVQTAGLGLFLGRFGPDRLAGAYLVSALATAAVSGAYLAAASRLPFPRLTTTVLSAIAAVTVLQWLGVRAGWDVAVYLLPAWFQVVMTPAQLVYWAVADSLFDVRQARRLFGTLTGGRSLGFLIGGLAAPLLLRVLDTADLLLVTVAAFAAAAGVLGTIWRLASSPAVAVGAAPPPIAAPGRRGRTFRALLAQRYHRAIIGFVTVWWIGYYVVDKLFLDAVAAHQVDPGAIAGFLGVFYALAAVAQLLVGAFGTARITARFGFAATLLATPALLAVLAAVFTAVAAGGGSATDLLVLAVALKTIDHAVGFALDFAVHGLAYRPLPLAVVGKVATLAEGFGQAVGLGITALGLLAIEAGLRVGPGALGVTLLAVTAAWIVLATDLARRYRQALAGALSRRQFVADRLAFVDRTEHEVLVGATADPAPGVALFAARTLGDLAPGRLTAQLPVLAGHGSPAVRRWAFDEAAARRDPTLLRTWTPAGEPDPHARAAGVRALLAGGADDAELAAWLDAADPAIRRGSLEAALADVSSDRRALGQQRAARILAGGSPQERIDVLDALADVGTPTVTSAAPALADRILADRVLAAITAPDPDVARAACRAAAALAQNHAEATARALVTAATRPATSAAAVTALGVIGPPAVEAIGRALQAGAPTPGRRALVEALTRIDGPAACDVLADLLDDQDGPSRAIAAHGLADARVGGLELSASTTSRAEAALADRVVDHGAALDLLARVEADDSGGDDRGGADGGGDDVLAGALRLLLRRVQGELVALAVVVARDPASAGAALEVERAMDGRRPAEVIELLEPALAVDVRSVVVAALERATRPSTTGSPAGRGPAVGRGGIGRGGIGRGGVGRGGVEEVVAALVAGKGAVAADEWLRAAACHHAGVHRLRSCVDALRASTTDPEPLVADTAARALARMDDQEEPAVLSTVETVMALKRAPLFTDTPDDVLAAVARLVEERQLDTGVVVVTEGDEGEELYVIASGRVAVRRGARLLDEVGDGGVFGEMAVLSPGPRSATVTTVEPTHLLVLEKGPLEELLLQRPEIALGIIRVLVRNLRERVSELAALTG